MKRVVRCPSRGYVQYETYWGDVSFTQDPRQAKVYNTSHEAHDVARHCGGATVYKRRKKAT